MPIDLKARAKDRLSRECGAIAPKPRAAVRVALAFPNSYRVGMASLGFQLVYRMLNDIPDVSCERVFLPEPDEIAEHERTGIELSSLESQTPISSFDAIAFSVSFEMDYVNVLRILKLAKVSLMSADRDERGPIVIAGGICAAFNPEPLADFMDAFVIGDAEPVLPGLMDAVRKGGGRAEVLRRLSGIEGLYVPSIHTEGTVRRAVAADLAEYPFSSVISTPDAEFGDIELVEVARGCARGCRFCVAGHILRPPRPRKNLDVSGKRRYGLVGAAVFDYPYAADLCRRIVESGGQFTVSSLRLETVTPEIARLLVAGGQKTLTIAPEAGSARLRRVIHKLSSKEAIHEAVANAVEASIRRIKLYFMVGLPTETDGDVVEIAWLVGRLADEFPKIEFQVSTSCFVPKPWTVFQWHPMEREGVLKRRLADLRKRVARVRRVKFSAESPRLAMVQGLLARGDRQLSRFLIEALENGGDYRAAIREAEVDVESYLYRTRSVGERLPWDHIQPGLDRAKLWEEYQRALGRGGSLEAQQVP